MEQDKGKEAQQRYSSRMFDVLLKVTVILIIPAVAAYLVGQYLDNTFDIKPFGSIVSLITGFILTWIILIRMLINLQKDIKDKKSK